MSTDDINRFSIQSPHSERGEGNDQTVLEGSKAHEGR